MAFAMVASMCPLLLSDIVRILSVGWFLGAKVALFCEIQCSDRYFLP